MVLGGLVGLALAVGLDASHPEPQLLQDSWQTYLRTSVRSNGRVIDHKGGGHTTSEGQAYAMLRAVWADDPTTFRQVHRWTLRRLQGGDPTRLPAWKYGRKGIFPRVLDPSPATDADLLMAWSLQLAGERWDRPDYTDLARTLARATHAENVMTVGGRQVLLPGPWAQHTDPVRVNPSYFLPMAMRDLDRLDPGTDWAVVIEDQYALLLRASADGSFLPDWLYLDPTTGTRVPAPDPAHERHGFEAMRLPWMLAAEVRWFDDPRARRLLAPYTAWAQRWDEGAPLSAIVHPDGTPAVEYPHLALTGSLLPAWGITRPDAATRLYATDIAPSLGPDGWGDPTDYYAQNWIWFGMALWTGAATPLEMHP